MNFVDDHILIKSNWFDKDGLISKTNCDVILLYLTLYKFRIKNQECEHFFLTSIKLLKKETGFTMDRTYELFKILIKHKIITCDITRWDRYKDNEVIIVKAIDYPHTIRTQNEKGEWYDKPEDKDDQYVSVDLNLIQYYLDNGLSSEEIAMYCLLKKGKNKSEEGKTQWSIDSISKMLGLSKDKVHKIIVKMNRMYLLASDLKPTGFRNVQGKQVKVYKFEHYIFPRLADLEEYRNSWLREVIEKNIKRWDKQSKKKRKKINNKNMADNEVEDDIDETKLVFEDQLDGL
jgi:hypothetical protein